jgi:hypothetical protein
MRVEKRDAPAPLASLAAATRGASVFISAYAVAPNRHCHHYPRLFSAMEVVSRRTPRQRGCGCEPASCAARIAISFSMLFEFLFIRFPWISRLSEHDD